MTSRILSVLVGGSNYPHINLCLCKAHSYCETGGSCDEHVRHGGIMGKLKLLKDGFGLAATEMSEADEASSMVCIFNIPASPTSG